MKKYMNKLLKQIKENGDGFDYKLMDLFRINNMYEIAKRLDWENRQRSLEEMTDINRLSYERAENYKKSINNKYQDIKSYLIQSRIKELEVLVEMIDKMREKNNNSQYNIAMLDIKILLKDIIKELKR